MTARYFALLAHWSTISVEAYERRVWRRLAWICRYGHVSLSDVLHMDTRAGLIFADELQHILEGENKPRQ